jgi:hypothetical protein
MKRLLTTTGKRIGYLQYDLSDGETGATIVLRVVPAVGYSLKALPVDSDYQIQARENGSGDPWVDIAATPIDLSGYTPETPVDFDFRVIAGAPLVDVRRVSVRLEVVSQGAAAWS